MKTLQKLGKSLMQPVAVLPVAALLMGIGYWIDPAGWGGDSPVANFLIKSGAAILDNLGILFAIGVAYGMSKDKDGAAALSGLVGFLMIITLLAPGSIANLRSIKEGMVYTFNGAEMPAMNYIADIEGFGKMNNSNVFVGILSGILASLAYNRFYQCKLPDFLSFFSGRRSTPIVTACYAIAASVVLYFVWPILYTALVALGATIVSLGPVGAGIYGFLNRLLIPTGLHHALNSIFWFNVIGINDIGNFWNSVKPEVAASIANLQGTYPTYYPGYYQAGFFPIMMFALPAAAGAMFLTAKNKKVASGVLLAGALASFVTGVTEPLEFSFMFLSPVLYLVHAVLTGLSVALCAAFGLSSGFSFSAGLIDYVLAFNLPTAKSPLMLVVVGLVFAVIYFAVFYFLITKFDMKTPGREDEISEDEGQVYSSDAKFDAMAKTILEGLGGKDNIDDLDYCITRLRVTVKDHLAVNEKTIKSAGISGVIRPSKTNVQVVVGPQVQFVKEEIDKLM